MKLTSMNRPSTASLVALAAYDHSLVLDAEDLTAWCNKGLTLAALNWDRQAVTADTYPPADTEETARHRRGGRRRMPAWACSPSVRWRGAVCENTACPLFTS
jgi:hypothetical protein